MDRRLVPILFKPAAVAQTPSLLDSISATPTAAFATFKLRNAYAGNDILARRSTPDTTTQDIGFSGSNQDTASLLTFCGAGDGFANKLYDQGASARDLTQATTSAQPQAVASGVLETVNSNPALLFASASSSAIISAAALSNFISVSAYTIITLVRPSSGADNASRWAQPTICGNSAGWIWHSVGTAKISLGHFDSGQKNVEFTGLTFPNTYVIVSQFNGSTIKGWLNGGASSSTAAANVGATTGTVILGYNSTQGTTTKFDGLTQACLIFNTAISLSDINTIGTSLAAYGGATWTTAS